jgi:hypothetical protein
MRTASRGRRVGPHLPRKLYSPIDYLGLIIAPHRKANVKRRDRIYSQPSFLSALQYVIREYPLHFIAFFIAVFNRHADVLALGIQLGTRESHADRKRLVFSRVKYESPILNFYLDGGAWLQINSLWLLVNDCCLSFSQPLAGFGHKAKPFCQGHAFGQHIQRKLSWLSCGFGGSRPGRTACRGADGQEDKQQNENAACSFHNIFSAATFRLSGRSRHLLLLRLS